MITATTKKYNPEQASRLKPEGTRILLIECDLDLESKSRLVTPDAYKGAPQFACILQIQKESTYKINDIIIFPKFSGIELRLDRTVYLFLEETEIVGTIKVDSINHTT